MKPNHSLPVQKRERGQTIIIAMVVLGVLLILGIVFLGIIDKSNKTSYNLGNRSAANDLSEAGIRYAHAQLLSSQLGADWRGTPTSLGTTNATLDPDVFYLRPAATLSDQVTPLTIVPGGSQIDLGGPDGLGPYFRVNFATGRALVRVRYAPSDANIFSNSPVGPLRHPGLARSYIIIEAVGREGQVNTSDPTTLSTGTPIQFRNFTQDINFRAALGQMKQAETRYPFTQVNRAFASIGIIETARFISNKYNVSRPADIGIPGELGAIYNNTSVQAGLVYQLGAPQPLYNLGVVPTAAGMIEQGGSMFSNANILVHGNVQLDLNRYLGDQFDVAGSVQGDSANGAIGYNGGQLNIVLRDVLANGTWAPAAQTLLTDGGSPSLDSLNPNFNTVEGTFRDGNASPDQSGNPRGVGTKGVPSIEVTDPDTGENRYWLLTADSGVQAGNGNSGLFGHGAGVFIANPSDIQGPVDEVGRMASGTESSQVYDYLNPNNGQLGSGWQGYLYVPPGAVFNGLDDGFTIQRDSGSWVPQGEQHWRFVDGTDTGFSFIRYRIGIGTDGNRHIVNSFTPNSPTTPYAPININGNLAKTDFDKGPVFNGVVYFQGNARVRGIIPTDVQITLVSNATIYIDGNITKGVTANGLQPESYPLGQLITRPSKSMMMLMAKDYVTINTTQFVAPAPTQATEAVNDTPNTNGFNPIRVRAPAGSMVMNFDFARDPNGVNATANNPSTSRPFEFDYTEAGSPSVKIPTSIVIAHTMDDGPAPATFFQWDVNAGGPDPSPYFFLSANNTAASYIPGLTSQTIQEYGLGTELDQRYPKFEQTAFTLLDPTASNMSSDGQRMVSTGITGSYSLFAEGVNQLQTRLTPLAGAATNDYILGRLALAPHDIQIQASIYAEEGSFFVIPGPWFNPNPQDRRDFYTSNSDVYAGATSIAEKNAIRFEQYGAWPNMPFYGEPLDVRIVITGAVSENMPPPASVQAEWLKKWGWIPADLAATGLLIPSSHVPSGYTAQTGGFVPNLIVSYDPALATARSSGFVTDNSTNTLIRTDVVTVSGSTYIRPLPPMPRLPVSPVLAYFGEVH